MKKVKTGLCLAGTFVAALAVLWLLLVAAACVPNDAIRANMEKSALLYRSTQAFAFGQSGSYHSVADHYADVILLNVSWNMGKENPFRSSIDTKYYDGGEAGVNAGFYLELTNSADKPYTDYTRYWHGWAMVIRPLHLVTDAAGVKLIGFIAVMLLALGCVIRLLYHRHYSLAVCFALSLAAVHIWNVRLSIEYQPAFVTALGMCLVYMALERRGDGHLLYLSVIGGTLVAFLDFLTVETVTILMPLILVVAIRAKEARLGGFKETLILLAKCAMCWLAAYAAVFLVKWTAASVVTGDNKFLTAVMSAGERVGGAFSQEQATHPLAGVVLAPLANLSALFGGNSRVDAAAILTGLFFSGVAAVSVLYLFMSGLKDRTPVRLLALLGSVVLVRYMVLRNHSYLHAFFTYRALWSTIMAILTAMSLCIGRRPFKKENKRR